MKYDYLIVGSGLFGSVFGNLALKNGKRCLVIDKRDHIGGNIYCENIEGINVHKYGPHIFHTNDKAIWDFVNEHAEFNRFTYSPVANYHGQLYSLPFNMNTFHQMWNVNTPEEAKKIIEEQRNEFEGKKPANLEEQAISLVGRDIYEKLIKGYTEKQWGRRATELPAFIIKRLPVRFNYDNNYYNDRYQGIPIGGYNRIIKSLLDGIEVRLGVDYLDNRQELDSLANKVVYTGQIDEFFDFKFGTLEYRALKFENEILEIDNYQGVAGMNYTDASTPYTRIVEHKHFEFGRQDKTVITKEYSMEWEKGMEPYYPVNDQINNDKFLVYKGLADTFENVIFGGRLAEYKYYDMHQVIARAIKVGTEEFERGKG